MVEFGSHLGLGVMLCSFLITKSISSGVIGLSRLSIFLLEAVLVVCVSIGICPFHLSFLILMYNTIVHSIPLYLFIPIRSMVMSSLSFLILVILVVVFSLSSL